MALTSRLWAKGPRYWGTALAIFLLAVSGSFYVYDYLRLAVARSYWFQYLLELGPRPVEAKFVRIVLVEDDEYWKGYPAGRSPIKRDYLAQIIRKLVAANVHVIAVDFDTRLPDPRSTIIPSDYIEETRALMRAIEDAVAQGKKVVLATPISFNKAGQYVRDADIYQAYGLCRDEPSSLAGWKDLSVPFEAIKRNVTCGYI